MPDIDLRSQETKLLEEIRDYLKPVITNELHQHKFVIPVEWENYPAGGQGKRQWRDTSVVTRLRCECGEETERNAA